MISYRHSNCKPLTDSVTAQINHITASLSIVFLFLAVLFFQSAYATCLFMFAVYQLVAK